MSPARTPTLAPRPVTMQQEMLASGQADRPPGHEMHNYGAGRHLRMTSRTSPAIHATETTGPRHLNVYLGRSPA
jgi:hypothetical protein